MSGTLIDDMAVDEFAATHLPWSLDVSRTSELSHSTTVLGDCWAVSSRLGGMVGERGTREIRRTEGEFLAVLLVRRGREVFTQKGPKAVVTPGSALLWDGVLPAECFSGGTLEKLTLFLPRNIGRQVLPHLDSLVGQALAPRPP